MLGYKPNMRTEKRIGTNIIEDPAMVPASVDWR